MANRRLVMWSGAFMLVGAALLTVLTLFVHPAGGSTLAGTFANDAASTHWALIHLGQFAGMAILLAGVLLLLLALKLPDGPPRWLGVLGAAATLTALAVAAVQYALDGVANKRATDAWATAVGPEKAMRFVAADTLRSLEIGLGSYHNLLFGIALVLTAAIVVTTARIPRLIGALAAVSGVGFLWAGWVIGTRGFTSAQTIPDEVAYTALFAIAIWLLLLAPSGAASTTGRSGTVATADSAPR